jgi:plasmid maintenance system antidote protein VapI
LITADTAVRLGRYFGNRAQFWLDLARSSGSISRAVLARSAEPIRHRGDRAAEGQRDRQARADGGRGMNL